MILHEIWPKYVIAFLVLASFSPSIASAEDFKQEVSDESLRVRGVFTSILPGTEKKDSLRFILHPHFGDFEKREVIRNDLGFSYGITENWNFLAKSRFYIGHGLKGIPLFSDTGFADYELETKFRLGESLLPGWDSAINLSYAAPIGNPLPKVTDGLIHREMTVSFARRLESRPKVRAFWGLTTDIVSQTDVIGRIEKNDIRDSTQRFSGGFIVERGNAHYTFESVYKTSRIWGRCREDVLTVRPGFIWQIPQRNAAGKKGQWLVGASTPVSHGPDGIDVGLQLKLKLNLDFKRMLGRGSMPPAVEVASRR